MPNYVKQKVLIAGSDEERQQVRDLLDQKPNDFEVEKDVSYFDFNRVIPMPDSLHMTSGSTENIAKALINKPKYAFEVPFNEDMREGIFTNLSAFYKTYFKSMNPIKLNDAGFEDYTKKLTEVWDKISKDNDSDSLEHTIQYLDNKRKYGATSWYDWACDNWGTKWNAGSVYWSDQNDIISFDTAWSIPLPVYKELAKKFPTVKFFVFFADEDTGSNCGIVYLEGDTYKYYDPQLADDDMLLSTAFANIIHGYHYESIEDYCDDQGYESMEEFKEDYGNNEIERIKQSILIEHPILNVATLAMSVANDTDMNDMSDFVKNIFNNEIEELQG